MKFYYNDQLVRTSKNNHYTHAVIVTGVERKNPVISCNSSFELAQKYIRSTISGINESIENSIAIIKAIESGKKEVVVTAGRKSMNRKVKASELDEFKEYLSELNANVDFINSHWKIVELEER